jgi:ribonuclease D
MSNWAADDLSPAQIKYAATDAWVSREIHARALAALPTEEKAPEPVPSPAAADTSQVEFQVRAAIAYEDDNIGKTDMWECNACDIS